MTDGLTKKELDRHINDKHKTWPLSLAFFLVLSIVLMAIAINRGTSGICSLLKSSISPLLDYFPVLPFFCLLLLICLAFTVFALGGSERCIYTLLESSTECPKDTEYGVCW
jgi:uncharacterized Tic20 family protein